MLTELKRNGLGITKHYPIIDTPDLEKLYKSFLFNTNIPTGLLFKVQFDVRLYFTRRGAENMRRMTEDELTKNHRENDKGDGGDEYMPEMPGNPMCPVLSFEFFFRKIESEMRSFMAKPQSLLPSRRKLLVYKFINW